MKHPSPEPFADLLFDPGSGREFVEDEGRKRMRHFIAAVAEEELDAPLGRSRYGREAGGEGRKGYRNGHRDRQITGTFGTETVSVPRARILCEDGSTKEWRSKAFPRYRRITKKVEALIANAYLAGVNTRRVRRVFQSMFKGAVSKDVVSRAWNEVKGDWLAWCARSLADEDIVRLFLDGTMANSRVGKQLSKISILSAVGVRRDGQKVLLSAMNMGGESTAAWRAFLGDLDARSLRRPEFVGDGAPGLEAALTELWGDELPIQRCTVHKHRNLLAKAPKHMHEELTEDYRDMIYAETAKDVEKRRRVFVLKWRLKCPAVANSLEEAGEKMFTFTRLPPSQWKSARTTNAIERLFEEYRRRIKTQTALPSAETAPMLLWVLVASGQSQMRKVDGWATLSRQVKPMALDLAA